MPTKTSTALVLCTIALVGFGSAAQPALAGVKWHTPASVVEVQQAGNTWTRTATVQPAGIAWKRVAPVAPNGVIWL